MPLLGSHRLGFQPGSILFQYVSGKGGEELERISKGYFLLDDAVDRHFADGKRRAHALILPEPFPATMVARKEESDNQMVERVRRADLLRGFLDIFRPRPDQDRNTGERYQKSTAADRWILLPGKPASGRDAQNDKPDSASGNATEK